MVDLDARKSLSQNIRRLVTGRMTNDEFDKAYEEGTMFLLTMHPQITGHRSRIVVLEKLIAYMKSKPGVWFATHEQVAQAAAAQMK